MFSYYSLVLFIYCQVIQTYVDRGYSGNIIIYILYFM